MEEIRCQKTTKYKGNLNTKLFFLLYDENALTTFLHSTEELELEQEDHYKTRLFKKNLLPNLVYCV